MIEDYDLAVVGAGYSGLGLAHAARRRGLRVVVFESEDRPGGKVRSLREEGCVIETGPLGWLDKEPALAAMARDLELEVIPAAPAEKVRYLLRAGRITPLPRGPLSFLGTPFLSTRGKLRVLAEPFVRARREDRDESARSFARRRLGREMADAFFEPFVSGIYAGDPGRLSAPAAFPLLAGWEREYGSLVRGAFHHLRARRRRRRAGEDLGSGRLCTFRGGLSAFAEAVARELGGDCRLGQPVQHARRAGERWVLEGGAAELCRARRLVLTVPAPAAAAILAEEAPELAAAARGIRGDPLCALTALYRREQVRAPCDGFGFLASRAEGFRPLGVQFPHAVFPAQTAPGLLQIRVLIGGSFDPEVAALDDADLDQAAFAPLRELLGIRGEPLRVFRRRVIGGVPQYELGHLERVAIFEAAARRLGALSFAGDSFYGVGIVKAFTRVAELARDFHP